VVRESVERRKLDQARFREPVNTQSAADMGRRDRCDFGLSVAVEIGHGDRVEPTHGSTDRRGLGNDLQPVVLRAYQRQPSAVAAPTDDGEQSMRAALLQLNTPRSNVLENLVGRWPPFYGQTENRY
jgi:hypothetical protein